MSIPISSTDLQVILTLFRAFNFVLSVLLSTWHWGQQFYKDITASMLNKSIPSITIFISESA